MKEEVVKPPETPTLQTTVSSNGQAIKLGKKLENPYSIMYMKKAYANIKARANSKSEDITIETTHYYVRFLPKSFEELAILQNDTTLELFDYPLDYELEEGGTYYQDPDIPLGQITWQYCAVSKDYTFPDLEYEILEELFLPESGEYKAEKKLSKKTVDNLINEAMYISGNISNEEYKAGRKSNWKPSGYIKTWDEAMGNSTDITQVFSHWEEYPCGENEIEAPAKQTHVPICRRAVYDIIETPVNGSYIPVKGCKVRANSWFTTKSTTTLSDGTFTIDHEFSGQVNYSIKWERANFDIRTGNWGQAYYTGPKRDTPWYLGIENQTDSWMHAQIHRAAHQYYYGHAIYGINPPPDRGVLGMRLHIGAMNKSGTSKYLDFNKFFTAPQVKVYCKWEGGDWKESVRIFGTTIHELAHASHWYIGYSSGRYVTDYFTDGALMPESWAECVEHVITSDVYADANNNIANNWGNKQDETFADFDRDGGMYTSLFIDLMDSINQRAIMQNIGRPDSLNFPIDRVESYTLQQLEQALAITYQDMPGIGIVTLAQFQDVEAEMYIDVLQRIYNNDTEIFVEELFENYYEFQ